MVQNWWVRHLSRSTELLNASSSTEDPCGGKEEKDSKNFNEGKRFNNSLPLGATFCLVLESSLM